MARRESSNRQKAEANPSKNKARRQNVDFDISVELDQLQEMIYESFHVPLTPWTMIDEGKIMEQIDLIYEGIPEAISKALRIVDREGQIISEAEQYAQQLVESAQKRAAQILDESGIIQQAEQQAAQIRQKVQQECEAAQEQTLAQIDQMREGAMYDLKQIRQQTLTECDQIQAGADEYAEAMLSHLEQNLTDMLKVVRNGKEQIQQGAVFPHEESSKKLPHERKTG
ncbi:MAG: hypothetical protein N5P05_003120 [Chroococcopsis gigantea SAG 12.99]|jgi:cell division septum initiation protein DivIVA|nr:hypothetical protein [Chlorogloea purpurea SAG 13.99]MDV3001514.1 hypothetical protein [Chroococcopsis gigantea SAG 12.99]